jgi:DNA-binding NarL/FixJ family response regulator
VLRVLIADDHSVMRRGVRSLLLAREDIEVCGEASDGKDAVNRAAILRPDLIILDLSMPGMDGFEAAKIMQRVVPNIPIIFYSMHDGARLVEEAKQIGVRGFVCKSDRSNRLLDAVEAIIDHKSTFFPDSTQEIAVVI